MVTEDQQKQKSDLLDEFETELCGDTYFIIDPGKFEGLPLWAAYYYDLSLNGSWDGEIDLCDYTDIPEDEREFADGGPYASWFKLDEDDWTIWPGLRGDEYIGLYTDDYGFVHLLDSADVARLLAKDNA